MNESLDIIFDTNGIIKKFKDDYIPRPSQIEGANKILESLKNNQHLIMDANTGFGKSFCYLVPTFEYIASSGFNKKAVIVTNGISLQEQLFYKDIPLVKKIFKDMYPESNFRFSLLKGKQNFVCNKKMANLIADSYTGTNMEVNDEIAKVKDWYFETQTGDFSELNFVPKYETACEVSCNKQGECTGKRCDKYNECFYQKFRQECLISDIIITNYHMLFSDMQTGNRILPKYDVLICDEAHEMANIYRDFLGDKVSANTIKSLRNDISEILNKDKSLKESFESKIATPYLVSCAEQYFVDAREGIFKGYEDVKLIENFELKAPTELIAAMRSTHGYMETISEMFDKKIEGIKSNYPNADDMDQRTKDECDKYLEIKSKSDAVIETLNEQIWTLDNCISGAKDGNTAWWLEKEKDKFGKDTGYSSINYRKVSVGQDLSENFFNKEGVSAVLASATLSVGGNFEYVKSETGLDLLEAKVNEFIGESPFDLTAQQLWYLPLDAIDGNSKEFENSLPNHIEQVVKATNGGALCLFTSYKNMNLAYDSLKYSVRYNLLKQGQRPRTQLIDEFKDDTNSVLLGTKSFFTGIDVPGNALRCVIIDKFPFPSPADPVMQKLSKDPNSFFKYFIPMMIIDLKQAVGRGVRSVNDKCVIVILDGRMATARYKDRINRSFGYQKTGTRNINDIIAFLDGYSHVEENKFPMPGAFEIPEYDEYMPDEIPF